MPYLEHSKWAVVWDWPENDTRWERVRTQEIGRESAFDIIGYLPISCTLDEARPYIESHLKNYPKEEVSRLRARMTHWNTVEIPKQQVAGLVTDSLDDIARQKREAKGWKYFGGKKR